MHNPLSRYTKPQSSSVINLPQTIICPTALMGYALHELLARDHVKIPCIFVMVPYYGMCTIVSVCCAWPMTLFSASLIRPLEGACIQMDMDSCSARMAYTSLEWHGDLAHMHHHVHLGINTDTLMKERQKTGHRPRLDNRIWWVYTPTSVPVNVYQWRPLSSWGHCRKGREGKNLGPSWSQGLFPSLSQLQINPFVKKSSRAHWKLPKETVWGRSKNKL